MRSPFVPVLALCLVSALAANASPAVPPDSDRAQAQSLAPPSSVVDFVIVTSTDLTNEFERLARWKSAHGLVTEVVTMESIRSTHPQGVDDAERLRTFLRESWAQKGTRWVLLGGDVEIVPTRHVRIDLSQGFDQTFASDFYFACLHGTWNADGEEFPDEPLDLPPELFVGRAPVVDATSARLFVNKTLEYERDTPASSSEEALLMAGDGIIDFSSDAETLVPLLSAAGASVTRLYERSDAWPGSLPLSRASALEGFQRGPDLVVQGGRGSAKVMATVESADAATYITIPDVLALDNQPKISNFFLLGASENDIDAPMSIGEALLRAPHGGAVTVIAPSDITFFSSSAVHEFVRLLYAQGGMTIGEAVAGMFDFYRPAVVGPGSALAVLGYLLLGDPTLRLHTAPATRVTTAAPSGPAVLVAGTRPFEPTTQIMTLSEARPRTRSEGSPRSAGISLKVDRSSGGDRGVVQLSYEVPARLAGAPLELSVFDLGGRRVALLERGAAPLGRSVARWNPSSSAGVIVPRGLYFARLRVSDQQATSRVAVTN